MAESDVEERVFRATVRIGGGDTWGTGWFIAPDRLITCAHVVEAVAGGREFLVHQEDRTFVVRRDQVYLFPDEDLAIIDSGFGSPHYLRADADLRLDDDLYAFGFTAEFPDGDSITLDYEGPTRGRVPLLKLKGGQVLPGMSGAAVYNLRTDAVCGVLMTTRDRRSPTGGRAVPLGSLERALHAVTLRLSPDATHTRDTGEVGSLLNARLSIIRDEIMARHVPGSERLRVRDLLGPSALLMPFRAESTATALDDSRDLASDAGWRGALPGGLLRLRLLVLAPPGSGKSTLALVAFTGLAARLEAGGADAVPLLLDLRDFRTDATTTGFGGRAWVADRLDELLGLPGQVSWQGVRELTGVPRFRPVILLDSVDEFLAPMSPAEVRSFVGTFLFQHADLVCCRTQFYERVLSREQFRDHEIVHLLPLDQNEVRRYTVDYYRLCHGPSTDRLAADFLARLDASTSLAALCSVPLRLNMALDLLAPGRDRLASVDGVLGLYHGYVGGLLRREAARGGSVLSAADKLAMLEKVAYAFYDEGSIGESDSPLFTNVEYERFIADISAVSPANGTVGEIVEDLRSHSLLHVDGAAFSHIEPGTLRFIHKSFQEYLVAAFLYHELLVGPDGTADAFRRYQSPEVSEFLKEYLVQAEPRAKERIASIGITTYRLCADDPRLDPVDRARARLAREQLGYYLAALSLPQVRSFFLSELHTEPDAWLRRGIVIGLAIGGDTALLDQYVDLLAAERDAGGDPVENSVNNGFNLTFFGDQPLDVLHPDRDQGGPRCRKTITTLVYQLQTETDRGSWRLDLYSLLDLWLHREESRADCVETLRGEIPALRRIAATLRGRPDCSWWRELPLLEELIATLS